MGKAKRRKKSATGFGKISKDRLSVTLNQDKTLPTKLEQIKQSLLEDDTYFKVGEVRIDEQTYPAIFLPYIQYHRGSKKLYSRVMFSPDLHPKGLSQTQVDLISKLVGQQIKLEGARRSLF